MTKNRSGMSKLNRHSHVKHCHCVEVVWTQEMSLQSRKDDKMSCMREEIPVKCETALLLMEALLL